MNYVPVPFSGETHVPGRCRRSRRADIHRLVPRHDRHLGAGAGHVLKAALSAQEFRQKKENPGSRRGFLKPQLTALAVGVRGIDLTQEFEADIRIRIGSAITVPLQSRCWP